MLELIFIGPEKLAPTEKFTCLVKFAGAEKLIKLAAVVPRKLACPLTFNEEMPSNWYACIRYNGILASGKVPAVTLVADIPVNPNPQPVPRLHNPTSEVALILP